MDTYKKRSFIKLCIVSTMLFALNLTTETFAQDNSASSTSTKVIETVTETIVASPVIEAATDNITELATGLNTVWMLLAAMLVFFMQPGFALVEAGFTRTKNTANILMKNFVDFMFGSLLYWFIGFAQNTVWNIRKPSLGNSESKKERLKK